MDCLRIIALGYLANAAKIQTEHMSIQHVPLRLSEFYYELVLAKVYVSAGIPSQL